MDDFEVRYGSNNYTQNFKEQLFSYKKPPVLLEEPIKKYRKKKTKEQILLDRQKRFPSIIPTGIIKKCAKCNIEKDESEFTKLTKCECTTSLNIKKDGRHIYCKICIGRKNPTTERKGNIYSILLAREE